MGNRTTVRRVTGYYHSTYEYGQCYSNQLNKKTQTHVSDNGL